MRNGLWTKGLIFGIILLFVGTSVVPGISGDFNKKTDSNNDLPNRGGNILVYSTTSGGSGYDKTCFDTDLPTILGNHGYSVTVTDRLTTPEITSSLLSTYDELWFLSTYPPSIAQLSLLEINTILNFYYQGHGLLIMADHTDESRSYSDDANQISIPLGVTYYGSTNHGNDGESMQPNFNQHPLFTGVQTIACHDSEALMTVNNPAVVVATYTNDDKLIAVLDNGFGRVVFDVSFTRLFNAGFAGYNWIMIGDTPQYVRNIADWLIGGGNQGGNYDRTSAVNYARKYGKLVCSDGYYYIKSGNVIIPQYYGAGAQIPQQEDLGHDCSHFVSCCIGMEPHESGGGLDLPKNYNPPTYGIANQCNLIDWLISHNMVVAKNAYTELEKGDIIVYDLFGDDKTDHAALYIGDGKIAAHSKEYIDKPWDYYSGYNPKFIPYFYHIIGGAVNNYQGSKVYWCKEYSPVFLHAVDEYGRHVGVNEDGEIEIEIPQTDYSGPYENPQWINVYNLSLNVTYYTIGNETGSFSIEFEKADNSTNTRYQFNNILSNTSTRTYLNYFDPYILRIDEDGDGDIDQTKSAPVTDFVYTPNPIHSQETAVFNSNNSYDPDGTIEGYQWNFGDNASSTSKNPTHIYEDIGIYIVNLTLTDNDGFCGSTSRSVLVEDFIVPTVKIIQPNKGIYIFNKKIFPFFVPLVIGNIEIVIDSEDNQSGINRVEIYLNNELNATLGEKPYTWIWNEKKFGRNILDVIAYDYSGNQASSKLIVWKVF